MPDYKNPMAGSPLEVKVISKRFGIPNSASIDVYLQHDGYKATQKALAMTPNDVINVVKDSGLRGRGGAGFNTGMKWSFVPKQSPKPFRCHVRAPSFANLQALAKMIEGRLIADAVACIGSLDVVLGEIDR